MLLLSNLSWELAYFLDQDPLELGLFILNGLQILRKKREMEDAPTVITVIGDTSDSMVKSTN